MKIEEYNCDSCTLRIAIRKQESFFIETSSGGSTKIDLCPDCAEEFKNKYLKNGTSQPLCPLNNCYN